MFFFVAYAYKTTTVRSDGYNPSMYEYSTLMAVSAVFAASLYNGMNTHSWNWWVFACVIIGPALVFFYTLIYSAISPGWIWTLVYGNNHYLLQSPVFWFGWLFTLIVALAPRYLIRYVKETYITTDIDILKVVGKFDKDHDYYSDPLIPGGLQEKQRFEAHYRNDSEGSTPDTVPMLTRTRTDMSGRAISTRGFAFDQADGMGDTAVGRPLRTWTSRTSAPAGQRIQPTGRARSGSVTQRLAQAIGFPSGPPRGNASATGTSRKKSSIFNRKRSNTRGSVISSGSEQTDHRGPSSPGRASPQSHAGQTPPDRTEVLDSTQPSLSSNRIS